MKTDAGMVWFDNTQPGTENPQSTGAICWVRHGERHGLDGWRRQQPAFGIGEQPPRADHLQHGEREQWPPVPEQPADREVP